MSILNVNKINPVGGGSTITIAGIASVTNNISVGNSVTAGSFVGSGANLTSLSSANLTGTIPDARFPATLPAASGANLTNLPSANLTGTLPAISGANLTGLSAGLKMADQWRVSTSQTTSSDTIADITAWSRNNNNFAGVGSALTNSGANFTFPSNGIYYVSYNIAAYITSGSARYISARLYFAGQDICHSWGSAHHGAASGQTLMSTGSQAILDVTNASTQTFKIRIQSSVPVVVVGLNEAGYNSSVNMSEVVVMRIGDT